MKKGGFMKLLNILFPLGLIGGAGYVIWKQRQALRMNSDFTNRYRSYYNMMNQWLRNKSEGKKSINYFEANQYKTIAIYGFGELANRLYEELKGSDIKIAYFIDKNADDIYYTNDNIPVVKIEDIANQESVDAIIITPIYDYASIEESLMNVIEDAPIISLEDVVYEM